MIFYYYLLIVLIISINFLKLTNYFYLINQRINQIINLFFTIIIITNLGAPKCNGRRGSRSLKKSKSKSNMFEIGITNCV